MAKPLRQQIIIRALELLSDDKTWTGRAMARDAQRRPCSAYASEAVRFCAVGALSRAAFELIGEPHTSFVEKIEMYILAAAGKSHTGLPLINDREGREAVVQILKTALSRDDKCD